MNVLKKVEQLQREELALDDSIRSFYDRLFPDFREELQRQFLSHFVVQRGAPTQRWRGNPADADPLVASFEELLDETGKQVNATLDDETEEALDDGYETMIGWLPELGVEERDQTQSEPGPWLLAATAALGLTHAARVEAWNEVYRAKVGQGLRGLVVGSATLPETVAFIDTMTAQLRDRIRALAGNERFRAFWVGADYAGQPFEDRIQWRWHTKEDEKVCKEQPPPMRPCAPLHLQVTPLLPIIDTHPGCVVGSTAVGAATLRGGVSKRGYEGPVVTIQTAGGQQLTVTPNHPVLASCGWKPAYALREGDKVLSCASAERVVATLDDHDVLMPAQIAEVFDTFRDASGMAAVEVKVAAEDFHGDGLDGQIAEIASDRLMMERIQSARAEHALEGQLSGRDGSRLALLTRACLEHALSVGRNTATRGGVSRHDLLGSSRVAHPLPFQALLLALRAQFDSVRAEERADSPPAEAEVLRKLQDGRASTVAFDRVVSITSAQFSGHVYNLDTYDGFYSGNGIIVANCRCWKVPEPRVPG